MNTVAQSATSHSAMMANSTHRRRRILLVDDEPLLVRLGEVFLDRLGYDVVSSTCPIKALEMFQDGNLDALITDLTMPGMSGIELASAIKKLDPNFPAILATAFHKKLEGKEPADLGFNSFLKKPYDLEKLSTTLVTLWNESAT
jgi:CheY-like chemotaxis protein